MYFRRDYTIGLLSKINGGSSFYYFCCATCNYSEKNTISDMSHKLVGQFNTCILWKKKEIVITS